jgi:hypothetical protein
MHAGTCLDGNIMLCPFNNLVYCRSDSNRSDITFLIKGSISYPCSTKW